MPNVDIADVMEDIAAVAKETEERDRRARWDAEEKARRKARANTKAFYMARVQAVLPKDTPSFIDPETGNLWIDGIDVQWEVDIDKQRRHISSWRSEETDKVRIAVGQHGDGRVSYPQRKDGTHDYETIAFRLLNYAKRRKEIKRQDEVRKITKDLVAALSQELGDSTGYGYVNGMNLSATADSEKPVHVRFSFNKNMTVDEVRELHASLKKLGMLI